MTFAMYWLGLLDLTEEGEGWLGRLNAYGRAFASLVDWPEVDDPGARLLLDESGVIHVPRAMSRYSRFQLARFTEWMAAGDPYEYRLSATGFAIAQRQQIKTENILTFLRRNTEDQVPQRVVSLIEQWGLAATATVTLRQIVVLLVEEESALEGILNHPDLRRYLGSRLGPKAVTVRAGQWQALSQALQAQGFAASLEIGSAE
jgi:hypothetical protein